MREDNCNERFCVDCINFSGGGLAAGPSWCSTDEISCITGQRIPVPVEIERSDLGICGKAGKRWERKKDNWWKRLWKK